MLDLPATKLRLSGELSGEALERLADWLEAATLVDPDDGLPLPSVVDRFGEEGLLASDAAWRVLADAKALMRRRQFLCGEAYPIEIGENRLRPKAGWRSYVAYSFCLLLSLRPLLPEWSKGFGPDHTEQGELFERIIESSLSRTMTSWRIRRTGWAKTSPASMPEIVVAVAKALDESTGEPEHVCRPQDKEAGLDIIAWRPFPDERGGYPVLLVQCASGATTWADKLHQPSLGRWKKAVSFYYQPRRAVAVPISINSADFKRYNSEVEGLLIDRSRIFLAAADGPDWLSEDLRAAIGAWLEPHIARLPLSDT